MRYVFTIRRLDRITFRIKVLDPLIVFFQSNVLFPIFVGVFFHVKRKQIRNITNVQSISHTSRTSTTRTSRQIV